jgi:predicted Zn-dependent protease
MKHLQKPTIHLHASNGVLNMIAPPTEALYKRALELDPNLTPARIYYAKFLSTVGRQDEAFAEVKRAQARDPVFPPR